MRSAERKESTSFRPFIFPRERIKIAKINVDENPNSPSKLGVRGIPALFIFKNGEMVSSKIGAAPKEALKEWIDEST